MGDVSPRYFGVAMSPIRPSPRQIKRSEEQPWTALLEVKGREESEYPGRGAYARGVVWAVSRSIAQHRFANRLDAWGFDLLTAEEFEDANEHANNHNNADLRRLIQKARRSHQAEFMSFHIWERDDD